MANVWLGFSERVRALDQLSPRERQVLRFLALFVDLEGYLPSSRLVAAECGLRSPSSAARIARVLENDGFVKRHETNPRLAVVTVPEPRPPTLEASDELLLAHVTLAEIESGLATDHAALRWAPDRAAVAFIHRSALRRAELAQLYDTAAGRLVDGGAQLTPFAKLAIGRAKQSARERVSFVQSWRQYCLRSALVEDALQSFLRGPRNLQRIHLQAAYEAELVQPPPTHPDVAQDWTDIDADPELGPFWRAFARSIEEVLAAITSAMPKRLTDELLPAFSEFGTPARVPAPLKAPAGVQVAVTSATPFARQGRS
jgi:hypothetical protein